MAKFGDLLADPNHNNQNINFSDLVDYSKVNTTGTGYSEGDSHGFDYTRSSLDRGDITPYDLPDLNDTRAANQGILSSLGDSTAKFVGKTALNVVGGIAGTIYGVGSSIANGNIKKLWDNSFNDKVDDIDKGLDNIFKVYKSSDYLQQNILQKAFLHPLQFVDDTTDALSFTAGAILTELLTSGIATEAVIPKALKYMKFLSKGAEAADATSELTSFGQNFLRKAGDAGTLTKQLATGASYESIIEARKATMDLRDKMYQDYSKDHPGEDIPQSVKDDIDNRLSKAGLFTYLSNLALVGSTNMAEFPKIFGLGYKTSRVAEGAIARDAESGLFKSTVKDFKDLSLLGKAGVILKNPYEEGIKEEGLQDVISNTAQQYWDRKNDKDSKGTVNDFIGTVAHNLADTYTSKEGWNDIGMGMIIGGLGAPGRGVLAIAGKDNALGKHGYDNITNDKGEVVGQKRADVWTGGVVGAADEHNEEIHHIKQVVDDLNTHTDLFKSMKANYDFLVQSNSLEKDKEKAIEDGDIFKFNNAKDDQIHAYTSARIKAGMYDDILDTIDNMKKLSPEEFYTQFKGEEAANNTTSIEQTKFQQEAIKEFADKAENTNQAIKTVDNFYKGDNEDLREQLIHSIAASKNLDVREKLMNQSLADLSGGLISNMALRGTETDTIRDRMSQIQEELKSPNLDENTRQTLEQDLENSKKVSNLDLTPSEHNMMVNLATTNPTDFTLNQDKIVQLLQDSRRLRQQRQEYLDLYNNLYTEKGQKQFQSYQDKLVQQEQDKVAEETKKKAEKEVEATKKKNIKEVLDKAIVNNADQTGQIDEKNILNPIEEQPVEENIPQNIEENGTPNEELPNVKFEDYVSPEVTNPQINPETNLDPEETTVVKVEQNKEVQANREVILFEDQLIKNPTEEQYQRIGDLQVINTDLQRTLGNTITYLGVNKIKVGRVVNGVVESRTLDTYDEDHNLEINEYVDPKLASQNYYNVGTKVNLRVPLFSEMQERGLQDYSQSDYTTKLDNVEEYPIAFYNKDNKIIGYLPTQSSIRQNVPEEYRNQALRDNLALRQNIFENRDNTYSTTITSKSPGFITKDMKDIQKSLFEALGNGKDKVADKVKLGVVKLGDMYVDNSRGGVFQDGEIVNNIEVGEGLLYSILPSSMTNKYIAYPMKVNKIGINHAKTIVEAIRLFAKQNTLTTEEQKSIDNITEYDLKNFKGLTDFINQIMYASSKQDAPDSTIFKLYKGNLYLSKLGQDKFSLNDIVDSKDTRDKIEQILSDRYHSITVDNLNNNKTYVSYSLDNDGNIKEDEYANYQTYLNNNKVVTSNVRNNHIEGSEYAFTAQSVIGVSADINRDVKQLQNQEEIQPEEAQIVTKEEPKHEQAEAESPKLTKKKLFDPNKVKPKPLEDISPEFIEKSNVKSGEDLMRKCL